MERKYWKSQGNLLGQKCGNHELFIVNVCKFYLKYS